MKAFENFFSCGMVLIFKYKVVLTFESVKKTLNCNHSDGSYWYLPVVLF